MAEITLVDAVWPRWGHASKNPELLDALSAKGIIFLGPPAASMGALGDKIGASLIAQAVEVPTLPWSCSYVEHIVTEWIAEENLPTAQVAVGMEIRRFYGMEHVVGYDAWRGTSAVAAPFDFGKAESTRRKGHCVSVRVTSEDPDNGFKPTSGKLQVGSDKY
ncbi:hypothetical protein ACH5RR_026792 [Cinchona calisaya]|uniref:Biotin carboxylation domain-containing protein n=1 Tax=Cinchona calisaya TaxID=153742 RepID=A0ABD2Z6W3_9GENT